MKCKRYTWTMADEVPLKAVRSALEQEGYSSLGEEVRAVIDASIGWTERVGTPSPLSNGRTDVLVKKGDCLLRLTTRSANIVTETAHLSVTMVAASDSTASNVHHLLEAACGGPPTADDDDVIQQCRNLEDQLAKNSQNGELLANPDIRQMIDMLYDEDLRGVMRGLADAYGPDPMPLQKLRQSLSSGRPRAKRSSQHQSKLIADPHLFSKGWGLACEQCHTVFLQFRDKEMGLRTLAEAKTSTCAACKGGKIALREVRAIDEKLSSAILQNVWLEHLVYSTMERRAATCVAGRIGSDVLEYDVAAVVAGRNVVVECKDGRFGQNDLPNLFDKARDIDAHHVGIVTTSELNANVVSRIEAAEKRGEFKVFYVDGTSDAEAIERQINGALDSIERSVINEFVDEILRPVDAFPVGTRLPAFRSSYR